MILEYKHSKEEVVNFLLAIKEEKEGVKKKIRRKYIWDIISMLLLIGGWIYLLDRISSEIAPVGMVYLERFVHDGSILVVVTLIYGFIKRKHDLEEIYISKLKVKLRKQKRLLKETTVEINATELTLKRTEEKEIFSLDKIKEILDDGNMLYIEVESVKHPIIIPSSAFEDRAQKDNFLSSIRQNDEVVYKQVDEYKRYRVGMWRKVIKGLALISMIFLCYTLIENVHTFVMLG